MQVLTFSLCLFLFLMKHIFFLLLTWAYVAFRSGSGSSSDAADVYDALYAQNVFAVCFYTGHMAIDMHKKGE